MARRNWNQTFWKVCFGLSHWIIILLVKTIARDLLPFISVIINNSLSSGYVPTAFKTARVVPILKKATPDSSSITNYKPNQLHDPNQSGYKSAHSTETALIAVTEKLHGSKAAKQSSVLILLDLSAAFDTVNHNILSVLSRLGVTGSAWRWFQSYLDGWSYQIIQKRLGNILDRHIPDVQVGFCKGRGTPDHITSLRWIMEMAREYQKKLYQGSTKRSFTKAFDCIEHVKLWVALRESEVIMRKQDLDNWSIGVKVGRRTISNLSYADDTILLAENEKDLKKLILKLKEESGKMGLQLNIKKTKIMTTADKEIHIKINNE
ncbi:hypothetical protein P4O66_002571 [Electrophorus voltai]|uniref:Reverse transcriptase domain-containing protein n=1 Tax=Electrophorus voltai TaxID=2609070 RepID=A0AAD9DN26_9TELE|nr:hypothetical protein P4O66_002571 [Electrophorus voltai]